MSNKLQNTKAVKQLLDGNHSMQNKTSISLSDSNKTTNKRVVGDTWTETNAKGVEFKWKEYSSKKMLLNAEGWFNDADKEVEILKTTLKDVVWENADGKSGEIDRSKWLTKIDNDYNKIKKQITDNLKGKND